MKRFAVVFPVAVLKLLTTTSIVFLTACDKSSMRDLAIELDLVAPQVKDVAYNDQYLNELSTEIFTLSEDSALIKKEYAWVKFRNTSCENQPEAERKSCLEEQNKEHNGVLHKYLVEVLLKRPPPITINTPDIPMIPENMVLKETQEYRSREHNITYSQTSGALSYFSMGGTIYNANLATGNALPDYAGIKKGGGIPRLRLSTNGKLLLVNLATKTELVYVDKAWLLGTLEHDPNSNVYFTKNNRYLLAIKGRELHAIDPITMESTGVFSALPYGHNQFYFNLTSKQIITWGVHGNNFSIIQFSDEDGPQFSAATRHEPPREMRSFISDIMANDIGNSVILFTYAGTIAFDVINRRFTLLAENALMPAENLHTMKDRYVFSIGYSSSKGSELALHAVDVNDGGIAFVKGFGRSYTVFADYPADNTLLMGDRYGVKLFTYDEGRLEFKKHDLSSSEDTDYDELVNKKAAEINRKLTHAKSLSTATAANAQQADSPPYQCKDAQGRLTFSDTPCGNSGSPKIISRKPEIKDEKDRYAQPSIVESGKSGLLKAVQQGYIRFAAERDLAQWKRNAKLSYSTQSALLNMDKYVVLKPIVLSGGLGGANAAIFIVNDRRLTPAGNAGHSTMLFSDTGACQGTLCYMLHKN